MPQTSYQYWYQVFGFVRGERYALCALKSAAVGRWELPNLAVLMRGGWDLTLSESLGQDQKTAQAPFERPAAPR